MTWEGASGSVQRSDVRGTGEGLTVYLLLVDGVDVVVVVVGVGVTFAV